MKPFPGRVGNKNKNKNEQANKENSKKATELEQRTEGSQARMRASIKQSPTDGNLHLPHRGLGRVRLGPTASSI